jgi:hypothetical protein
MRQRGREENVPKEQISKERRPKSTRASVTARVGPSRIVLEMTRQPRQPSALTPFLRSRRGRRKDDVMRPVWSRDSRVAVPLSYDSRWLTEKAAPWRSVAVETSKRLWA